MRTYDFAPLFRSTVGFDRLFDMLDTAVVPTGRQQHRAGRRKRLPHQHGHCRFRSARNRTDTTGHHADRERSEKRRAGSPRHSTWPIM